MPKLQYLIINIVAFQVAWFCAVISAGQGMPWAGAIAMLIAIAYHLMTAQRPVMEFMLVLLCGGIGAIWDSLLVAVGILAYPSGNLIPNFAPYWIVVMWMLFATTLNVSLGWLKNRLSMAIFFGAIGGPLAFFTGQKLGGVIMVDFTTAMTVLAVGWGTLTPLLLSLATRFDGVSEIAGPGQRLVAE